jgi:hypothetical protein
MIDGSDNSIVEAEQLERSKDSENTAFQDQSLLFLRNLIRRSIELSFQRRSFQTLQKLHCGLPIFTKMPMSSFSQIPL